MSKISVFKFNINNNMYESQNIINNIVGEYLRTRGFYYNNEQKCYTTGEPTQSDKATNIAANAVSLATSMALGASFVHVHQLIQHGLELEINANQLIIKAYLINTKMKSKQYIHSPFNSSNAAPRYYGDLKNNLFKKLQENNIVLVSTEVEKIDDGSEKNFLKI